MLSGNLRNGTLLFNLKTPKFYCDDTKCLTRRICKNSNASSNNHILKNVDVVTTWKYMVLSKDCWLKLWKHNLWISKENINWLFNEYFLSWWFPRSKKNYYFNNIQLHIKLHKLTKSGFTELPLSKILSFFFSISHHFLKIKKITFWQYERVRWAALNWPLPMVTWRHDKSRQTKWAPLI